MDKKEKNNKLIAEFMGLEVINDTNIYVENNMFGRGTGTLNSIRYHESWDWIIPVLQKIEELSSEQEEVFHQLDSIKDALLNLDIEEVHLNVAEFVKWYNNQ